MYTSGLVPVDDIVLKVTAMAKVEYSWCQLMQQLWKRQNKFMHVCDKAQYAESNIGLIDERYGIHFPLSIGCLSTDYVGILQRVGNGILQGGNIATVWRNSTRKEDCDSFVN